MFEKGFHTHLTALLISLITNPNTNPKGAQLIITTHDENQMDRLDGDQIVMVEKDYYGASELFTRSDIRGLRGDTPDSTRYLRGELYGLPNINHNNIYHNMTM